MASHLLRPHNAMLDVLVDSGHYLPTVFMCCFWTDNSKTVLMSCDPTFTIPVHLGRSSRGSPVGYSGENLMDDLAYHITDHLADHLRKRRQGKKVLGLGLEESHSLTSIHKPSNLDAEFLRPPSIFFKFKLLQNPIIQPYNFHTYFVADFPLCSTI